MRVFSPVALAAFVASAAAFPADSAASSFLVDDSLYWCKTYPGDWRWPSESKWQRLNISVDGNLQVVTPPGAPCYSSYKSYLGEIDTYNEEECATVQSNFGDQQWTSVFASFIAVFSPWFSYLIIVANMSIELIILWPACGPTLLMTLAAPTS